MHSSAKAITRILYRFYLPLSLAIALFILAVTTNEIHPDSKLFKFLQELKLSEFGVELPIGKLLTELQSFQLVAGVLSLALLIFAFSLDLSSLFPKTLSFDIFYNVEGIREKVNELDLESFAGIKIVSNWEERLRLFDERILNSLVELWGTDASRLSLIPDVRKFRTSMSGSGTSIVRMRKVGLMHYKFAASGGRIELSSDLEKKAKLGFVMDFSLKDAPSCHVRLQLRDLFPTPHIELGPEYKQILSADNYNRTNIYDHSLRACSRLKLFPFPTYSDSVYLFEIEGEGYIPIGYCVYQGEAPN